MSSTAAHENESVGSVVEILCFVENDEKNSCAVFPRVEVKAARP